LSLTPLITITARSQLPRSTSSSNSHYKHTNPSYNSSMSLTAHTRDLLRQYNLGALYRRSLTHTDHLSGYE